MSSSSYSVDNVPQAITNLFVTHIRVVAHTMGPIAPGTQLSQNHWSIYLVHSNGSIRLNMQLQSPSTASNRGLLTVASYEYTTTSTSAVKSWDFAAVANVSVWLIIQLIRDHGRQNYDMTIDGAGCRHWISVFFAELVTIGYVSASSVDGSTMESIIHYNYSIGQAPIPLKIKQGRFLENSQSNTMAAEPSSSSSITYAIQSAEEINWSDWVWSSELGQWYRTRAKVEGGWDYQYQNPNTTS